MGEVHAQAAGQADKSGFNFDVRVGNTLVNIYAKVRSIEGTRQVLMKWPLGMLFRGL